MLISYLWLKDLVEFDQSPEKLAETLTSLGLECSLADDRRGWYQNMVVGKVMEVKPHPNADKLRLCRVDTGDGERSIVCGAPNVAEGQIVPVALQGAKLPNGMIIEKRKVRGEVSDGMICSEAELGLSEDHDGIMVLDDGTPGDAFSEKFEVCDVVLEVDLTPNRGDCLSMIGIAREVAAATGGKLKPPPADIEETSESASDSASVKIEAPDICPRYAVRVIKDAQIGPSPFWMRRRLAALGVRSINNVVDITNYVLMETGHPLHAFDHSLLAGAKIIVRRAREGEKFTTLDDKEHTLSSDNLVIADVEKAVALAGVMGGQNSEVSDSTKDILLESAYFDPRSIRRTAKSLGISSESSYRFERGTDVEGLIYAQDRAASLIEKLTCGVVLRGRIDAYPEAIEKRKITLRIPQVKRILGIEVGRDRAEDILKRLLMDIASSGDDAITVAAPHFRHDIEREIDLIEEVARLVGYGSVPTAIPRVAENEVGESGGLRVRRALRRHLSSLGMMEGMRVSFMGLKDLDRLLLPENHHLCDMVPIDNPLTSEWTHLRSTLTPGLIASARGAEDAALFEIGVVFKSMGADRPPKESWSLGGMLTENLRPGIWTGRAGKRDFYHVKGVVESILAFLWYSHKAGFSASSLPYYYPKRQAELFIDDRLAGSFGQVHPETLAAFEVDQEVFLFEMDLEILTDLNPGTPQYKTLPRFPSVKRDLAVVAPEDAMAEKLTASIRRSGGDKLREAEIFDIFRGEKIGAGKKSVAFSLEFRDDEKTMTDEEVDRIFDSIVDGLRNDFGAELR